jgi:transcriptional regulator PpsR
MLNRNHGIDGKEPFRSSADLFGDLDADAAARLATVAGDISLILDDAGTILDGTANTTDFPDFKQWIGRNLLDTVTVESRPKVMEMLAAARKGQTQRWRQINHLAADGEFPVRYAIVSVGEGNRSIALGRDMRDVSALQQRLLQTQQSLERDYLKLRQVEQRYRLLFELSHEPVLIVEADSYRIKEANPAADQLLGAKNGSLVGDKLTGLFAKGSRDALIAFLGSVMATNRSAPFKIDLANSEAKLSLSATGFRQFGGRFLLVRLQPEDRAEPAMASATLDVLEHMPDAFVLADGNLDIVAANVAFIELVGVASADQLYGRPLADYVGRPGIDLDLITGQLSKHGYARNVSTVIGAQDGFEGEPVEVSAVATEGEQTHFGFVVRTISRRLRDLPPTTQDLPRSVEQLTELVGRMALKDIVRESTDLIERLCIEAALTYTENNRASAAEILGLSRQSLYSKLHRYGLGNLMSESD